MKSALLFCAAVIAMIGCTSCSHYYYAPNSHAVPMLREQHEARLLVAGLAADEITGTEIQAAYSPLPHLGIFFNSATAAADNYGDGHGHQIEGGAGYYHPLDNKVNFEVYAGFGGGAIYNRYDSGGVEYAVRYQKAFIQPGVGYATDYFDAVFSLRLAYLAMHPQNFEVSANPDHAQLNDVASAPHSFLMEPAFTVRGGYKFIKVQAQWSISSNLTNPDFPQEKSAFSIGLYASFSPRWLSGLGRKKARQAK